ncbi:sigma-54 interaction domain-containing protein [Desulfovibrio sp. QI0430]
MNTLICWIGNADLSAAEAGDDHNLGPIAQALKVDRYTHVLLLNNYLNDRVTIYRQWLTSQFTTVIDIRPVELTSPTNHKEIYESVRNILHEFTCRYPDSSLTFHISPGTPAMALVWLLLAPTYGARVIESSRVKGVQQVQFPFEIAAYFLPDRDLSRLTQANTPAHPAFKDVLYSSPVMQQVVQHALNVAPRDVTILIEGESGTGKELFARAIHAGSLRAGKNFIAVNCGAIPAELIESQLFGYKKGAFTNALKDTPGYFQSAEGGTLFLDELGELPPAAQVKLLRALEERAVTPVGCTQEEKVNVRIIAATNKNLMHEVAAGRFRSDLFYRLAVGIVRLPALRERGSDLELLLEHSLKQANEELAINGKPSQKQFSDAAKNILLSHSWPGNVRELKNTVMRAALWSPADLIDADSARQALLVTPENPVNLLDRPIGNGFSLKGLLDMVESHYLKRAMHEAGGVKTKAADLLGLGSYQTLTNWLAKQGLK